MSRSIIKYLTAFVTVIWAAAAAAATPAAPPQVLGLVATKSPLPLTCENGVCSGFFSAFCLQEHRPPPLAGQVYEPAGSGTISLLVTAADGRQQVLSATGLLEYTSIDGYTAVKLSMPMARLAALDSQAVAVDISRHVALVPRLQADYPAKLAAADRETASGPKRLLAESFFENNGVEAAAAYTISRMINLLPANGNSTTSQRHGLWQQIRQTGVLQDVHRQGQTQAKNQLQRCNSFADQGLKMRMRGCLANAHDRLLKAINKRFWDSTDGF